MNSFNNALTGTETDDAGVDMGGDRTMKYADDAIKEDNNSLVFSYLTLRNLIGFCGASLPLVLLFATRRLSGDRPVENSISDYYYTSTGDILVVLLSVLGVFLFTYNGYNRWEKFWTTLAAICGVGVAFSPTSTRCINPVLHFANPNVPEIFGVERHLLFAGTFLFALGIISFHFFPKTNKPDLIVAGKLTPKGKRNRVYKCCGVVMFLSVGILIVYLGVKPLKELIGDFPFIFTMESIAVEAFALSWLTKGETFWPDGEHYLKTGWKRFTLKGK